MTLVIYVQGTVPGKSGLPKPGLDTSEEATANILVAPKLAAAMIGDRNDVRSELCHLERRAIWAFEARDLLKASHFYMDVIKKIEALDDVDTHWIDLARANVGMSRTLLRLGNVHEASDWQQEALALVQSYQSEDPSEPSACTDVSLRYHQSHTQKRAKKGRKNDSDLSAMERQVALRI